MNLIDGERRRVRDFFAVFLGEVLRKSCTSDSADLEALASFLLLLVIFNAADMLKNFEILRQITEYRYCGLGTGEGWSKEPDGEEPDGEVENL